MVLGPVYYQLHRRGKDPANAVNFGTLGRLPSFYIPASEDGENGGLLMAKAFGLCTLCIISAAIGQGLITTSG